MIILIVDDEPKILQLLAGHFEHRGHTVYGTGVGREALALFQQHHPHVALLDLWLKGELNGLQVLEQAQDLSPGTRVIIVTGDEDTQAEQVIQKGAAAFFKKPIQLEELDRLVDQLGGTATPPS